MSAEGKHTPVNEAKTIGEALGKLDDYDELLSENQRLREILSKQIENVKSWFACLSTQSFGDRNLNTGRDHADELRDFLLKKMDAEIKTSEDALNESIR